MGQAQRRKFVTVAGLLLAAPLASFAQQQSNVRRIGFLAVRPRSTASNPDVYYDAFTQGMRELGYVEGMNLVIEWRFSDNKDELLPILATELVRMPLEVIVTHSTPAIKALQQATGTIPIVSAASGDPVGSGFAASLARPGGNITGLSLMTVDVIPKQIELMKLVAPALSRAAVLADPRSPRYAEVLKSFQTAAQRFGVVVFALDASTPEEIERGFVAMKRERADAVIVRNDPFFFGQRRQIAELATRNRLPSMFSNLEDVRAGGLMSYGLNLTDHYRRAASYVDKILRGAKPSELPIEQPTRIYFAINLKTAKALGISVPKELMVRADALIE